MAEIEGFRELSAQLSRMGRATGKKVLRAAAMQAALPALRAAQAAAPVGHPPYEGYDPYPLRTYKGRLRTPGFLKRNIARKAIVSSDGTRVQVLIGPRSEAFYGVQFIEFGTSRIPKRPWLEPSFRASIPAMNQRLRERLRQQIDKAVRGR